MLIDVLNRVAADTGLHPIQKRTSLLTYLQTAADEIHNRLECTKIYREVTLAVLPDSVVSLPHFIGELKGMRMHTNELPFDLHSIGQPRYVSTTLGYKYKNWRDLGESCVQQLPIGVGPLTITCQAIETPPVVLSITGQTNAASKIEEKITLNANSVTTTNLFTEQMYDISCPTIPRQNDITISDYQNNIIAVLSNNQRKTRYKIVDVSQIFWTLDTSAGESLIDVLYKIPKARFGNDSDSFYAGDDFDEAWYDMTMWVYQKPITAKAQEAATHFQTAMNTIAAAKDSSESGITKKLSWGRNKFHNLFKKYRYYPGSVTNVDHNIQS